MTWKDMERIYAGWVIKEFKGSATGKGEQTLVIVMKSIYAEKPDE